MYFSTVIMQEISEILRRKKAQVVRQTQTDNTALHRHASAIPFHICHICTLFHRLIILTILTASNSSVITFRNSAVCSSSVDQIFRKNGDVGRIVIYIHYKSMQFSR
jgi:hypothetical protein